MTSPRLKTGAWPLPNPMIATAIAATKVMSATSRAEAVKLSRRKPRSRRLSRWRRLDAKGIITMAASIGPLTQSLPVGRTSQM